MKGMTVLQEAQKIIHGPRRNSYGPARKSFERVARLWSEVLDKPVTPEQVALCMVMLKVARELNKPGRDNKVDICGYVALMEEMEK